MSEHKNDNSYHVQPAWFTSRTTFMGDAVITTDSQGRVTSLNPVAESMTGWAQADAVSLSLETVFQIVNPETRLTVESPTVQALRDGINASLPKHTVLIAKDGRESSIGPIDHSASPIRNDLGKLTGAVLVFRDTTYLDIQERQVRAALAYADNIIETLREPFLVLDNSLLVKSVLSPVENGGAFRGKMAARGIGGS